MVVCLYDFFPLKYNGVLVIKNLDLHLKNILLRLPDRLRKDCKQLVTSPMKRPVIRCDGAPLDSGVPSEAVIPIWLGLGSDELTLLDSVVAITDFGEAYDPLTTKRYTAHTPLY